MDMVEQSEDERIADAYLESAYDETGLNGTAINWRYWVHQMPVLSAAQAACLMSALEPDLYASLNGRHGQDGPARNITKARKIQRLAEANGKLTASPDEWIAWAKTQRISVHTGFLLAVGEPKATAPSEAPEGDEPPAMAVAPADYDTELAVLFEPVRVAQLEAMFPSNGNWTRWAERAACNGLRDAAKDGRAMFNPYRAAVWWLATGPKGWKWERCLRVLANNLPARAIDSKHLLIGYDE